MTRELKNIEASVKRRLYNLANKEKLNFDFVLLLFMQERLLYRLSISKYNRKFILKGGLLLICLKMPRSRPTKDIDFLAEEIKNDPVELEHIFRSITAISCNDGVKFISSSCNLK